MFFVFLLLYLTFLQKPRPCETTNILNLGLEFVRWGRTDRVELFCTKFPNVSKRAKKYQTVPMKFGPFSKSATHEPNITTKIQIAPRSGASGIAIVIVGAFIADFENGPNVIGTFWHFLKLLGTFCKKVQAHLARPI